MPVELMEESAGNVLGMRVKGRMSSEDYKGAWVSQLDAMLEDGSDVCLLIVLEEFEGIDAGGLWEDLKYAFSHFGALAKGHFKKTAIVGGSAIYRQAGDVFGHLIPGEVKSFEASEIDDAWAWVRS
jgi:SpoIIAA-like